MGGKSSDSKELNWSTGTSVTTPWSDQVPFLQQAFVGAKQAYDKNMDTGPYKGDYVALGDSKNNDAYQQAYDFGMNPTNAGYVQNLLNSSNNWLNNGSDWMKAGGDGLKELSGDQTGNIIANGNKYADNPYIGDAVKAAMFDANRNAAENIVPNIYRSAAGSNTLNSDRAALSQGVVDRGLAEQALNTSATMRYNQLNSGLDRAAAEVAARRGNYGTLASLGSTAAGMGAEGLTTGINDQSRLNQMSAAGAEGLRSLRQDSLNNDMAKYEGNQNFPWSALNNFYNIIGNKSWGGTQTTNSIGGKETQTQENPGLASTIGGGLGAVGSLFSGGAKSAASGLFSFL